MRRIGIGLVALLLTALLAPPALAQMGAPAGATRPPPKGEKEAKVSDETAKGMAAAPGLISAGNLDCQLAGARFIGEAKDAKTKTKTQVYELACANNEGLIVQQAGAEKPESFTCEQAAEPGPDGKPNKTRCTLPENSNPKAGLQPYVAKSGHACTIDKIRTLGQSATNNVFEVACSEGGGGFVLEISNPPRLDQPVIMEPCVAIAPGGNLSCTLTDRATQLAVVDQLMAKSGKACTIKDRSYVGSTATGMSIFEVSCQDGKGYMIEQEANGALKAAVDCAAADTIAGGCKLTDARQAKTEQTGLYTKLAHEAGFDCTVSGYAPLAASAEYNGKDVVELACSNRPDGAVAVFPASGKGTIYDCAHSEIVGFRCGLTKASAAYGKLTADLQSLNKKSCTVSEARVVGMTADKRAYVEVGCSDGLPGFMIEYTTNPIAPKSTIVCSEAKGISGGCSLPGNTK